MENKKEIKVIDQIFSCYNELFDAEKRVADYILENSDKVIEMTVSELADASEASNATIVRVCKKCGCKGFHHLKIKMAKETTDSEKKVSNDIDINDIEQSLHNILSNKYEELKQTLSNINVKELAEIIKCIQNARMVIFAALGNTIPIALDGAYKFNELGIIAFSSPIWENQLAVVHTISKEDVVIAISSSGESKNLLTIADTAMEKGATVIAITNYEKSSLALKCKYHISAVSRERLFFKEFSFTFTRLAAMAVIETLFFLLASSKADSHNCINAHEQSIADDKI